MPRTKTGEKISWKEFGSRWKQGIEEITPLQQVDTQIYFTRVTLLGVCCGFGVTLLNFKSLWWLSIVLGAAVGNTFVQLIALKQKQKMLRNFEQSLEGGEVNEFLK